jgi:nuclear transcription Y subunit beta
MSSSSPDDSSPMQRPSSKHSSSNRSDSDANIRNFAPVARIMKSALPENAKIAKEAKECMQECVSEFISFITSEGEFVSALRRVYVVAKTCLLGGTL